MQYLDCLGQELAIDDFVTRIGYSASKPCFSFGYIVKFDKSWQGYPICHINGFSIEDMNYNYFIFDETKYLMKLNNEMKSMVLFKKLNS